MFSLKKGTWHTARKTYWFQRWTLNIQWAFFTYRDPGKPISFENKRKPKQKQKKNQPSEDQSLRHFGPASKISALAFLSCCEMVPFFVNILFKLKTYKVTGKEGLLRSRAISNGSHLPFISSRFLEGPVFWHFPNSLSLHSLLTQLSHLSTGHMPSHLLGQGENTTSLLNPSWKLHIALNLVPFQPYFLK